MDVEQRIGFEGHLDGLARFQKSVVDDAHPAEVVIDRVVAVFHQPHPASRHRHRPLGDVERVELDFGRTLRLEASLDSISVEGRDLLCGRLRAVVQRLEHQGLNQAIPLRVRHALFGGEFGDFFGKVRPKRLYRRKENPAVLAVDRSTTDGRVVHVIEHPVLVRHAVDVDAVHAQHLNQEFALEWRTWNVVEVHP